LKGQNVRVLQERVGLQAASWGGTGLLLTALHRALDRSSKLPTGEDLRKESKHVLAASALALHEGLLRGKQRRRIRPRHINQLLPILRFRACTKGTGCTLAE
jgi:hypothetical protein